MEMAPVFKPETIEKKWEEAWESSGLFTGKIDRSKTPFSMVIPPPNITGNLHMGHALNTTIQDILTRFKKMQGFSTCWFPGTDHAGISTQVMVERQLKKEGKSRFDLGREKFVERVWEWRNQYGGIIDQQLRKLGVGCDWSRYAFTLDETRSAAVRKAFVSLYNKKLIYRDRYIVNWCPSCRTALSDLEVEHSDQDTMGTLYHLRYPLEDDPSQAIIVATVRPETMLGDAAVAVHPKDPRYQSLIGKTAILPIVGRKLPIIADEWADPSVGSGAVKITPAHDPNDFEVGKRHHLTPIVMIDHRGKMDVLQMLLDESLPQTGKKTIEKYEGLDRFEARKQIVEDLREQGILVKEEQWPSNPGRCARSGDIIEPYLSVQWFVRMKDLAKPAIDAVRSGKISFVPERFSKLYFDFMENIRDWCVSRQLWWGHRIPAWYCLKCNKDFILKSGHAVGFTGEGRRLPDITEWNYTILEGAIPTVAETKPETCSCGSNDWIQDPDVLDTWFSSGLWPLSTMGWPDEKAPDLQYFYPTSVLSTGRDIIFLWVARMIMMGLEFSHDIPFRTVYIHPTILDKEGKRMSKSKGTGVDPLDLIKKYGADATRFGMIMLCQGQDVRFHEEKIEQARNFTNKIWNAARLILSKNSSGNGSETYYDRWILGRYANAVKTATENLSKHEFSSAASILYDFFWDDFCDWYLELSKRHENRAVLMEILTGSLKLLHPFMPFLTEEIWQALDHQDFLAREKWPEPLKTKVEPLMDLLIESVKAIRNLRSELGLKPKQQAPVTIKTDCMKDFETIKQELVFLTEAGAVTLINEKQPVPQKALSAHISSGSIYIPLEGLVDLDAELKRLNAAREKSLTEIAQVKKLLGDPAFSGKAKPEVIQKTQEKEKNLEEKLSRLDERITALSQR